MAIDLFFFTDLNNNKTLVLFNQGLVLRVGARPRLQLSAAVRGPPGRTPAIGDSLPDLGQGRPELRQRHLRPHDDERGERERERRRR